MTGRASGAAIVTTLADAGEVLDSFVAYHLAIGFSHLYLFFDDPADPDFERISAHPNVTATRHDADLRQAWSRFPELEWCRGSADREVMSRQILNTRLAMDLARADGLEWLLHIDADELFHSPGERADAHFAEASASGVEAVSYYNHEAVPETEESGDFFRTVTLFKRNKEHFVASGGQISRLVELTHGPGPLHPGRHFNYYDVGKSAVRLTAPAMQVSGVHGFDRPGGFKRRQAMRQVILHYACCGLEMLWRKYKRLGAFDDRWWDSARIVDLVPFHIYARDAVATSRDAALALYRVQVMLDDPALITSLTAEGVLERVTAPSEILAGLRQPE